MIGHARVLNQPTPGTRIVTSWGLSYDLSVSCPIEKNMILFKIFLLSIEIVWALSLNRASSGDGVYTIDIF